MAGTVLLVVADVSGAAPTESPVFTGNPQAPTAPLGTNTSQVATTAFVHNEIAHATAAVTSINGKTGEVSITANDVVTALAFTPVESVAGHRGNVVLTHTDITDFNSAVQHIVATTIVQTTGFAVTSINGREGAVQITANDVVTALAFTPVKTVASRSGDIVLTHIDIIDFTSAVQQLVVTSLAQVSNNTTTSINGREGAVQLNANDIVTALAFTPVESVAGHRGNVVLTHTDITDFTSAVQHIVATSFTQPIAVTSINGREGAIQIIAPDVITALGFTPVESVAGHRGNVVLTHTDITDFTSAVQHVTQDLTTANIADALAATKYIFTQSMPSNRWVIVHNLGFYPSVTIVDSAGTAVEGDVQYASVNRILVNFAFAFAGLAYLS